MYAGAAPVGREASGLVVLPEGYPAPAGVDAQVRFSTHPEPDASSVAAARRALAWFAGFRERDLVVCLVSGGTSSLLALPRPGLTLREKRDRVRRLARSGASIGELNRLRTSLSAVKGGRLGRATKARLVTLVLSDVAGDDPRVVGSGPTVRGRRGDVVRVVGTNSTGLAAAARAAAAEGLTPVVLRRRLAGEASEAGVRLARRARELGPREVLLAGGETTVDLGVRSFRASRARGGRCLELAAGAAGALAGSTVRLLAVASDGRDGSSGAAGAFADGTLSARAAAARLSIADALSRHDTAPLFEALGDLVVTGPTGTNVCDWVFALGMHASA
jgi:hydroxypyruvate reductase